MLAYAFKGIGKFAVTMLPWQLSTQTEGLFTNENLYAIIILVLTSLYVIKGGMVSVVITEVMQFTILTITSIIIGVIAMYKVSPEMIAERRCPTAGSIRSSAGSSDLDWTGIFDSVNDAIRARRQRMVRHRLRPDVLQGHPGQPRRPGAELRHAARAGHAQSARSLHDERHGQRACCISRAT